MTRKQIGAICGAILLAVITPLVVLALLHALDGTTEAAPAAQDYYQDPTFSIAQGSASPFDPADALTLSAGPAPPPVVARACAAFGLLACGFGDDINSGSLGDDFKLPPPDPANPTAYLYFSVAPGSTGFVGTGVYNETVNCTMGTPEPEADEFGSAAGGSNYQFLDGDGVNSCSNPGPVPSLGLFEPNAPPGWPDDLDAVDPEKLASVGFPIYGTASAASPTLGMMAPPWNSPAAIHVDNGAGFVIPGYATPAALGLAAGDDIDALCIHDVNRDTTYDPAGGDIVWFSLAAGSPSLATNPDSPADVFAAPFVAGSPVVTAAQLGLNFDDELNALKCYATGADIKVLTFYSDPEGPFTLDVSTYNVIDLIENKHNNGPEDALVDVWWYMDPIDDRDGDGIPDINVRWEAEIDDLCTYQGLPVACGEGDGVGSGGSGDGFPSLTGDNCQDDIDNDGDTTCDVNGCTAYPNSPDPDCGDVDDIHFQIYLSASISEVVQRPLKMHCKPRSDTEPYTLSLYNEEWPVEMDDPDPFNNFQQLDIEVTCQQADPHYKCYDIYYGTGDVPDSVMLEDQFTPGGVTGVEVGYPYDLCPPAIKYVDGEYAGGGFAAPHLKAYAITGMPPADATVNITTQFGTETDVYLGSAHRLLVPALKAIAPDDPTGTLPDEPHYVCYWTPAAAPPPGLIIDLETQFGTEPDVGFATIAGWLCAPALKDGVGSLTAPHLRCYRMAGGTAPGYTVNLMTQFGFEYDVDVGEPWAMCVPALKEHVVDETDVKILDQYFVDPPTDIDVSVDTPVTLRKVIHSNGPYTDPVLVDIAKTASAPPGCTILPGIGPDQIWVPYSVDVVHDEIFDIHCDEPSTHGPFTIDNLIAIKDPVVTDPDPLNNTASSSIYVNAWAYADVKIMGQQILAANCLDPPPTEIDLSEDVTICVHKLLHNNGLYGPVNVDVIKSASASPGATIVPPTHTEQLLLYPSDVVPHVEYFTIHCTEPSTHTFYVDNDVVVKDEHVIDPDGASASSQIDVNCLAYADVKASHEILDADCVSPPPTSIPVSEDVTVCVRKQLHNNGPYGPVDVDIYKNAFAGGGGTIDPPTGTAQLPLPSSSTVTHDEFFTIHCYDPPGPASFTVNNTVTPKDEHVIDPNGAGDTDTIYVDCTEGLEADSKVTDAGVYDYLGHDRDTTDGDLDIWDTDNVAIELISEEHNNGPNEALSRFTFLADVPLGCGGEWINEFDTYRPFDPL
ncbi:MAG: hypothetical protein JSU97_02555, partial [Dehalococcoidia bacterium]